MLCYTKARLKIGICVQNSPDKSIPYYMITGGIALAVTFGIGEVNPTFYLSCISFFTVVKR
jgi:hypothetical protein